MFESDDLSSLLETGLTRPGLFTQAGVEDKYKYVPVPARQTNSPPTDNILTQQ